MDLPVVVVAASLTEPRQGAAPEVGMAIANSSTTRSLAGRRPHRRKHPVASLPSSLLTLTPLQTTAQGARPITASLGNFAENAGPAESGLFSLLLSQLGAAEPLATPTTPADDRILAKLSAKLHAEPLPLAGNALPLAPEGLPPRALQIDELPDEPLELGAGRHATVSQALVQAQLQQVSMPAPTPTVAVAEPARQPVVIENTALLRKQDAPVPEPLGPVRTDDGPEPAAPLLQRNNAAPAATPNAQPLLDEVAAFERPEAAPRPAAPTTVIPTVAPAATVSVAPLAQPAVTHAAQPSFVLEPPVADPGWGDELGQRLVWMTENGVGRAQLRMNPPELGPIEVRMAVANDDARVSFHVQHGATREALEAALPRLREMFASQGLNLADANVSEQSQGDQRHAGDAAGDHDDRGDGSDFDQHGLAEALSEGPPEEARSIRLEGTIDAYA